MSDEEILQRFKKYFKIEEFVNKKTASKFGQTALQFICPRLLHTMLVIREAINKPITINTWHKGGRFSQRGLRTNIGQIVRKKTQRGVLYLSAHTMGKAVDFDVKGMTAEQVRAWLKSNIKILPYKIRLEHKMRGKPIGWVHLDVFSKETNNKIYLFNV